MGNLTLSAATFWLIITSLPKFKQYHPNLIRLLQLYFGSYYVNIIARGCMMATQFGMFRLYEKFPEDLPLLTASVLRIMFTSQYACLIPALLVERSFATLLVSDYEKKRRPWIFLFIYITSLCVTALFALIITLGNVSLGFCMTMFFLVISAIFLFIFLLRYNRNKLNRLSLYYRTTEEYTLSIRFQVAENLKVMKQILNLSSVIAVLVISTTTITIFSFVIYGLYSIEGQIFAAVLEMWVALSANVVACVLFCLNNRFLWKTLPQLMCKTRARRIVHLKNEKAPEGDLYFSIFAKQW